ncbi:putative PB1 domain-containing protein [Medicago truncatula]|nr:putative PB1 domain-containing protein [Medicago truncatula]
MAGLRAKIRSIFYFTDDAKFTLSYVDEDAEMVNLVDDNDLNDLMNQRYKFWRIYVRENENGILPLKFSQWRNMIHKSVCKLMQKEEAIYYGSAFVAWVGLLSAIIFAKPNVQVVQPPPPPPSVSKGWFW